MRLRRKIPYLSAYLALFPLVLVPGEAKAQGAGFAFSATPFQVEIVREPKKKILNLVLKPQGAVLKASGGSGAWFTAQLEGQYTRKNWNLLFNKRPVRSASKTSPKGGTVRFLVFLKGNVTPLELVAIGPLGEMEKENLKLRVKDWNGMRSWLHGKKTASPAPATQAQNKAPPAKASPPAKRVLFSPSLGYTSIAYQESRHPDFSETALTFKFGVSFPLMPPRLDAGIVGFVTALPLSSNIAGDTARFLGVNARVGYVLPWIKEPWRVSLMGGGYYTTMIVTEDRFGFKGLMGPQVFPTFRWSLSARNALAGYLKFSPVGDNIWIASLSNREIAGGLSWIHVLPNGHSLSAAIDIARLQLLIEQASIHSDSNSISFGYSF